MSFHILQALQEARQRESEFREFLAQQEARRDREAKEWERRTEREKRELKQQIEREVEQRRRAQHASIAQLQRQKESLLRQQRAFEEAMAKIQSEAMQSKATAFRALQEVERQHQLLSVGADGDVVMEEEMGEETPTGFGFDASTGADNLSSFSMTAGATSSMSSRPSEPAISTSPG